MSNGASLRIHIKVRHSKTISADLLSRSALTSALVKTICLTDEKGKTRDRFQTGDRRLIVRALPLHRTSKDVKKRADCHLWPKGTFIQIKYLNLQQERILSLPQRKQQSHAPQEWKGISHPLDLTSEVDNIKNRFEIKLCSKEIVENSENDADAPDGTLLGSYAVHVAICERVEPDALYDQLMGKTDESDVTIPLTSLRSARKMAKEYISNQTVSMIDSDDEDNNTKSDQGKNLVEKSLTFSLLCPISKVAMQTPVRGRHCQHMQCFDLKNWLYANKNLTGGRWRCGVSISFCIACAD